MFPKFGLVLMVNHACNLRCTYCYTGRKSWRPMSEKTGRQAIARALASVRNRGTLELSFFGGEPLLAAELVSRLLNFAFAWAAARRIHLEPGLTTNGTIRSPAAWAVMTHHRMNLVISHDGLPVVHDSHRRTGRGNGTSGQVVATMQRLIEVGKEFRVVTVVRPDTLEFLARGIRFLRDLGVPYVELSLDLWTEWSREDMDQLRAAVRDCADIWKDSLPRFGVSWFDEKAAHLSGMPIGKTARCGFGRGQVAVAPSGNLYPCERLIGEDDGSNPVRIPGHVSDGPDFIRLSNPAGGKEASCSDCAMESACSTSCRCSNYVRTRDTRRPDALLCFLNRICMRETARRWAPLVSIQVPDREEKQCTTYPTFPNGRSQTLYARRNRSGASLSG